MSLRTSLNVVTLQTRQVVKDFWESSKWPRRPQTINFEITAACDAKCIHCPREDMDRPKRAMNLELFKRMVDQAAELQVPELCPNGYGEILLLRNLDAYLNYIRNKRWRFKILVNTNGHLMSDEKIDLFLKYQVHLLNVTIDGATPETAQAVRVNLDTKRIEDNIHRLMARRKQLGLKYPKVRVGMILIPQNAFEADQFLDKWQGKVEYVGFGGFTNRAGSLEFKADHSQSGPKKSHPCVLPFKELNVWADGKVVLCCDDWNEEHVVGDLNVQTLKEIWQGTAMKHARRLHKELKADKLALCAKCNYWREPSTGARLWS